MHYDLAIPKNYRPLLDLKTTERAIRLIKEFFQINLAFELDLIRVTAPLFVQGGTGINDDLNGVERPISFHVPAINTAEVEIVQSLAKWKRMILADYGLKTGEGIYTDMNAIRPDEKLDNTHSIYVDQWDWEKVITSSDRTIRFLKEIVKKIYGVICRTEKYVAYHYESIRPSLPEDICFVHSEELEHQYPNLSPRQREYEISREYGAVFIIGIGAKLKSGQPHDGRAPDYDDWSTPSENGYLGLNGDILVYNSVLDSAFELSSMGIRVDREALLTQLELCAQTQRTGLLFHKRLLNNELPLSIGGGIGQSRLCMLYLRKAHIGEIQCSIWPAEMIQRCKENNINLL